MSRVTNSSNRDLWFEARLDLPSEADVRAAIAALEPELNTSRRFTVHLSPDGNALVLRVDAADLSALRAALNSYLRWLYLIEMLIKNVGSNTSGDADGTST